MAEGLRPHHHCCFIYDIKRHYNHKKHCVIKKVTYKCMMCDYMTHEVYECYEPPPLLLYYKRFLIKINI